MLLVNESFLPNTHFSEIKITTEQLDEILNLGFTIRNNLVDIADIYAIGERSCVYTSVVGNAKRA